MRLSHKHNRSREAFKKIELSNSVKNYYYTRIQHCDEYCISRLKALIRSLGLARDHPESYHYYMWNEFFKHVDIEPGNAHVLDGNAPDLVAECQRFEDLIKQAGGVHLFVGGRLMSPASAPHAQVSSS